MKTLRGKKKPKKTLILCVLVCSFLSTVAFFFIEKKGGSVCEYTFSSTFFDSFCEALREKGSGRFL